MTPPGAGADVGVLTLAEDVETGAGAFAEVDESILVTIEEAICSNESRAGCRMLTVKGLPFPGRHWEYHAFEYVHVQPDTQVLDPLKP